MASDIATETADMNVSANKCMDMNVRVTKYLSRLCLSTSLNCRQYTY
jgi:hypothetical protein